LVAELAAEGLVQTGPARLIATRKGRAVLDSLVSALVTE
jgi:hypothetical protein